MFECNLPENNIVQKSKELYAQSLQSVFKKSYLAICIYLANKSHAELSAITIYKGDE